MSFVATLICHPSNPVLTSDLIESLSHTFNASARNWLADGVACDLMLPQHAEPEFVAEHIRAAIDGQLIDFVVQDADKRAKKILIADMDSTMIEQECIDELAAELGLKDEVSAITARAMNGEIEFEPALRERVALLKGLATSIVDEVISKRITLMSGGLELVRTMKKHGAYCALVSGGFTLFTSKIAAKIGFDENRANVLLEQEGSFTGEVEEPILGRQAKVDALYQICQKLALSPDDAIAVGDGANDLGMLGLAGSGVALHAKPSVAAQAKMRIDHCDLTALLYLQGYRQSDFV